MFPQKTTARISAEKKMRRDFMHTKPKQPGRGTFSSCPLYAPCAASVTYFLCMGLRIEKDVLPLFFQCGIHLLSVIYLTVKEQMHKNHVNFMQALLLQSQSVR